MPSFRKLLLGALALGALWFGGRALWRSMASPETKIRWRIESMVEGFHEMRSRKVLEGIAKDFTDGTRAMTREELRQILAWLFLNEIDSRTGEFLYRCEFDPATLAVELEPGEERARVRLELVLTRRSGDVQEPFWDARLAGEMAEGEDGWQWTRLLEANHADRRRR